MEEIVKRLDRIIELLEALRQERAHAVGRPVAQPRLGNHRPPPPRRFR